MDYDLIVVKTLERVYKNYYYIIRGEMQIMGLFSKFKKEKTAVDWSNAYTATPKFYAKPDGSPFGAIALTEGTETILARISLAVIVFSI